VPGPPVLSYPKRAGLRRGPDPRRNDTLIDARGNFLADRDTLRVAKIVGTDSDRQIFTERGLRDGSWTTPFEVPEKYLVKSAELGYASTIFSAQGRTVDVGHSLITDGMSREALYVTATRGRMENRLHVVTGANDAEQLAEPERKLAGWPIARYDPPPALASSTLL
jgi:hypothetical protein